MWVVKIQRALPDVKPMAMTKYRKEEVSCLSEHETTQVEDETWLAVDILRRRRIREEGASKAMT